jgi:hypothetical protein
MCKPVESHESTCDWLRERNKSLRSDEAFWQRVPAWVWFFTIIFLLALLGRFES